MIIVEGPRNTGKSFLINEVKDKFNIHKFNFIKYNSFLNLKDSNLFYFTCGKDLAFLEMNNDIILDRSFLSTLVYAKLENRVSDNILKDYCNFINDNFHCDIVFVYGKNDKTRENKDIYSGKFSYEDQYDTYLQFLTRLYNFKITYFSNKFNEHSVGEFDWTLRTLNRSNM